MAVIELVAVSPALTCPTLPAVTVEVQPVYFSEVYEQATVIDPFHNGTHVTVSACPSTVVIECYITTTKTATSTATTATTTTSGSSSITSLLTTTSLSSSTVSTPSSTVPVVIPTTCALNTVTNPNQQNIAAAINQWRSDVSTVNAFLEAALGLSPATDFNAIRTTAESAYGTAVDEPCQFQTLQNAFAASTLGNDTQYICAKNDLASIFGTGVLGSLQAIIETPSLFQAEARVINTARCCQVLPDVSILFTKADQINPGASPQPSALDVPRPSTCGMVDCSKDASASKC